jgi:hypothetical protein
MFVDSNGMVVRRKVTEVVDTLAFGNADMHYDAFPSYVRKPSTTLTYEGTKMCRGVVVVEKHAPQHDIGETHRERHEAQTKCAYNDLATNRGHDNASSIVNKREPPENGNRDVRQNDACHNERSSTLPIGRGRENDMTTTKDRRRVKVVRTVQKTVGYLSPQEMRDLVTGRDNGDGGKVARAKPPRKPPDKALSGPERNEMIKDDRRIPNCLNNKSHCLQEKRDSGLVVKERNRVQETETRS